MKKALIVSLLLHVLLFSLAFFLVPKKREQQRPPFFAQIVTPGEMKEQSKQSVKGPLKKGSPSPLPPRATASAPSRASARARPLPRESQAVSKARSIPKIDAGKEALSPVAKDQTPTRPDSTPQSSSTARSQERSSESSGTAGTAQSGLKGPTGGIQPKSAREKLFDPDILAKLAEPGRGGKKPDSSITFDSADMQYYGYMQRLKEKIEGIWRYPSSAAERGLAGDLYIKFTIKKNGRLGAVELERTSGYRDLDDAAIKALRDADPYWPIPNEWQKDAFTITGHFVYTLHGVYIR
ncbi:MAG: energy transducer TonB [Dissulfurispiraceae bacterium]